MIQKLLQTEDIEEPKFFIEFPQQRTHPYCPDKLTKEVHFLVKVTALSGVQVYSDDKDYVCRCGLHYYTRHNNSDVQRRSHIFSGDFPEYLAYILTKATDQIYING